MLRYTAKNLHVVCTYNMICDVTNLDSAFGSNSSSPLRSCLTPPYSFSLFLCYSFSLIFSYSLIHSCIACIHTLLAVTHSVFPPHSLHSTCIPLTFTLTHHVLLSRSFLSILYSSLTHSYSSCIPLSLILTHSVLPLSLPLDSLSSFKILLTPHLLTVTQPTIILTHLNSSCMSLSLILTHPISPSHSFFTHPTFLSHSLLLTHVMSLGDKRQL